MWVLPSDQAATAADDDGRDAVGQAADADGRDAVGQAAAGHGAAGHGAAGQVAADQVAADQVAADQVAHRFIEVDGIRLRTCVRGSGQPMLVITGLGASLDFAVPFERELAARGLQVISFDAPGVGQSTPYNWPRRMPGYASTIHRMVEALGYERVDVFGVSLGGVAAQQLARQSPDLVRRLILAATGPGVGGVPGSPRVLLTLATPRRYYQPDYYRRVAGRIYGGSAREDPDALLHGSVARFIERPSVRGYFGQIYSISGWTSMPWLHRLPQPTLVLAGDDDPIVPLVNGYILARLIRRARLHVIRGGGHLFLLEQPVETAVAVADFLTAKDPVPSG